MKSLRIGEKCYEQKHGESENDFFNRVYRESDVPLYWFLNFVKLLNEIRCESGGIKVKFVSEKITVKDQRE